jgi:hypothetical protein
LYLLLLQAVLLTWCYMAAVLVDPGQVPAGWHPFPDDAVREQQQAQQQEGFDGSSSYSCDGDLTALQWMVRRWDILLQQIVAMYAAAAAV